MVFSKRTMLHLRKTDGSLHSPDLSTFAQSTSGGATETITSAHGRTAIVSETPVVSVRLEAFHGQ